MTAAAHLTATDRVISVLTEAGRKPRREGSGWVASCPCPTHGKGRGDRAPSLSISAGQDGNALLNCHAGCDTRDVVQALGLEPRDLFTEDRPRERRDNVYPLRTFTLPPKPPQAVPEQCADPGCTSARRKGGETCVARYAYTDAEGTAVGVVHRWDPKTFRPFTPDGKGGWKVGGSIPPVPYALPRALETLRAGGVVLIVEGEKDADTVNAYGHAALSATTNAGGAKKWTADHADALHRVMGLGAVVICGDADTAGEAHVAATVKAFTDAGLPAPMTVYPTRGKDLTEHLDNGGTVEIGSPNGLREPATYPHLGPVLTLADLADLPPIRAAVDGWVSTPSAVLFVGGYALGKSALMLSMGLSVASGTPFLGADVEQRRTLFVVGEGARGLPRRVQAWEKTWGRTVPADQIRFMTKTATSLRDPETWKDLRRWCKAEGVGFVVLDTFSSLAPDADETKDAPLVIAGLNDLAEAIDGTAILVHHPGWSQATRARGSYALEGNVDEVLILDAVAEGSDHVSVKVKKRKDGEAGQVHYLRRIAVDLGTDENGDRISSVTMEHARLADTEVPLQTRVTTYLAACGDLGASPKEIANQIGADPQAGSFKAALTHLTGAGQIVADGASRSRRYRIADDG